MSFRASGRARDSGAVNVYTHKCVNKHKLVICGLSWRAEESLMGSVHF